ncbi:glycosyltransferase involved in cell wall biosynthesis [Sphingobium fontiphilum]|uniref:Glycosyltransferase involved in cell wall biosynthesis n=1 Tax=Sphingobium fontiphilum TaxID=944425 RepID=A0A7W6DGV6_9SPHN|nr:glycosyltransferase family 2 protein [Sphingobium fontiphilum]MBB3980397.1 glycosyltransferase involved in cell wall biosynthesis [Sphingobium fontiphilum]
MSERTALSIVIPVLDEQDSLSLFLDRARPAVNRALALIGPDARAEYLFVDDGSTDRTADILMLLSRLNPDVRFLSLSRNFGKEAALAAGIDHARGDAVIPIDVDLQDPPEVIIDMVRHWLSGARVVNARRVDRSSDGWLKRWTAHAFYRVINRMSDHPIPENVGDFRLLDREAVEVLRRLGEQARFNKGLFSWIGFRVATVDYERAPREAGATKWRWGKLWALAIDGITASTTMPLRIWSYIGGGIAMLAFGYAAFLVIHTLITGVDTPGYASIMVAVLMLGGLNLMSLGIIGEYLGRVAREVRNRPLYVVAAGEHAPSNQEQKDKPWTAQPIRA